MVPWIGFVYAAFAAIGHSGIDATRKLASQKLNPAELVGLVGVLDAFYLTAIVFLLDPTLSPPLLSPTLPLAQRSALSLTSASTATPLLSTADTSSANPGGLVGHRKALLTLPLVTILVLSSAVKILAGVMYQRALQVSPLSVTVPYLAFVPALILVTGFFLLGEIPSFQGITGVCVVTIGGYLLALNSSRTSKAQQARAGKGNSGPSHSHSHSHGLASKDGHISGTPKAPSSKAPGSTPLEVAQETMGFASDLVLNVAGAAAAGAAAAAAASAVSESSSTPGAPLSKGLYPRTPPARSRQSAVPDVAQAMGGGGMGMESREGPGSSWDFSGSARGRMGLGHGIGIAKEMEGEEGKGKGDWSEDWGSGGVGERGEGVPLLRVGTGAEDGGVLSGSGEGRPGEDSKGMVFPFRVRTLGFASRVRSRWTSTLERLRALGVEEGTLLMLCCAICLSLTNGFDKMGLHNSPSVLVFAWLQRLFMGLPPAAYLVFTNPASFNHLLHHFPILSAVSFFEILAIVFYLKSVQWLLVSYAVAAKRINILVSVFVGHFVFKEQIWRRMPYILLMMAGMLLVIFAPT